MKFLVDENMPIDVARLLNRLGHDARSIAADKTLRGIKDPRVIQICDEEQRILLTNDHDFMNVNNYPPAGRAGIVVFHLSSRSRQAMLTATEELLSFIQREKMTPRGRLWIVSGRLSPLHDKMLDFTVRVHTPSLLSRRPAYDLE